MALSHAQRVALRYLRSHLRRQMRVPFEYERAHVPRPRAERPGTFQYLPQWGRLPHDAPDPERAEEEYAEESTFDSPEYGPGGRGYKGQFRAFREKYGEVEVPNPMPRDSYFGWQPRVKVDTLIGWTDGDGSDDIAVAHRMQRAAARIVRTMFRVFRRSQTTR